MRIETVNAKGESVKVDSKRGEGINGYYVNGSFRQTLGIIRTHDQEQARAAIALSPFNPENR